MDRKPFLWSFVKKVSKNSSSSDGQERPFTASLAEENRHNLIELDIE